MGDSTNIEWCDATVNFWEGCTKVGPGCDFCYAADRDRRFHKGEHWGPGAPRRWVKGGVPLMAKLQRSAHDFLRARGHRPRVFVNSLSDFFDNEVEETTRLTAATAIEAAPDCDVILVTKRIGNLIALAPAHWLAAWPRHVGILITVVNQEEADRDIPKLLNFKARYSIPWVGLSCEPLLGPIDLTAIERSGANGFLRPLDGRFTTLDWVIAGGESDDHEKKARPAHPDWFRGLRDQCAAAGVPFFFKQWGEYAPVYDRDHDDPDWRRCDVVKRETPNGRWINIAGGHGFHGDRVVRVNRAGKKHAGALLDGAEHREFPTFGRAA